jgi:peptidoglycan/xylan/chitin deacetylase (PgdA/CDA1 family)
MKPIASLSLDLDNKWSYLKTHGDADWESFPTYFDEVVPRFLGFLDEHGIKITVFVVGQDADLEKNHASLKSIADAGHEIGNHSFHHEPWLHLYTPAEIEAEFSRSEAVIKKVTGQQTVGFRGPGFSLSDQVLKTMVRRGYKYDCTSFPTFLGPVARAYYFFTAKLSKQQKEERKALFGSWKDGFQTLRPFKWVDDTRSLPEIPVTTMPFFKVPIHASYIMYLAGYSKLVAKAYFWSSLQLCRMAGVRPSILLHPLDFMGKEDDQDLAFFPAMNQSAQTKIELLADCIKMLKKYYDVGTMLDHLNSLEVDGLKCRRIDSATEGVTGELVKG